MKSVVYVSQSTLPGADAEREVLAIVEPAQKRNAQLGITGALVYTGSRFAQLLEGPPDAVHTVLSSIRRDRRHKGLILLPVNDCSVRRFDGWAMAYNGQSTYIDRHVRTLFQDLTEDDRKRGCETLVELMLALRSTKSTAAYAGGC